MPSDFVLQIVDRLTGEVVTSFEPGARVETVLLDELLTRVRGVGVGMFKSSATVERTIRDAWVALLYDLKTQVVPRE